MQGEGGGGSANPSLDIGHKISDKKTILEINQRTKCYQVRVTFVHLCPLQNENLGSFPVKEIMDKNIFSYLFYTILKLRKYQNLMKENEDLQRELEELKDGCSDSDDDHEDLNDQKI